MKKYGFVYCWTQKETNKKYIGSHYGNVNDGYICSSEILLKEYQSNPELFERTILVDGIKSKQATLKAEQEFLDSIPDLRDNDEYYNLSGKAAGWPDVIYRRRKDGDYTDAERKIYDGMKSNNLHPNHQRGLEVMAKRKAEGKFTAKEKKAYDRRKNRMANGVLTEKEHQMIERKGSGIFTDRERAGFDSVAERKRRKEFTSSELDGYKRIAETKRKNGTLGKNYLIKCPDGSEKQITDLKRFCEEVGISYSSMRNRGRCQGYTKSFLQE